MLKLKQGVSLKGLTPEMLVGIIAINTAFNSRGFDCVITSCNDATHSVNSKHYKGNAVDVRTKHITTDRTKNEIVDLIKLALDESFDIILENAHTDNEHLHVEYDPK